MTVSETDLVRAKINARLMARLDAEESWLSHFGAKSLPEDYCIHHEDRKEAFLGHYRCRECDLEAAEDARETAAAKIADDTA